MKRLNYIYIVAYLLMAPGFLGAQNTKDNATKTPDTLRRELTVITDRKITLDNRRGFPLSIKGKSPHIEPFTGSLQNPPSGNTPYAIPLGESLNPMAEEFETSTKKGFVNFGLGLKHNFRGDFGYRFINKENRTFDIFAANRSTDAPVSTTAVNQDTKALDFQTLAGLRYKENGEIWNFGFTGTYLHRFYNFYGIIPNGGTIADTYTPYAYETPNDAKTHRIALRLDLEKKSESLLSAASKGYVSYNFLSKGTDMIQKTYHLKEHHLQAYNDLYTKISHSFSAGILGQVNFIVQNQEEGLRFSEKEKQSNPFLSLSGTPYLKVANSYDDLSWSLLAGIGISFNVKPYTKLLLTPKVSFDLSFGKYWQLQSEIEGGFIHHTLYETLSAMPFLTPDYSLRHANEKINARIALKGIVNSNISMRFFGEYSKKDHDLFFNPNTFPNIDADNRQVFFKPYYANTSRWSLGGMFGYKMGSIWETELGVKYNNYSSEESVILSAVPTFESNAKISLRPLQKVTISIGYDVLSGRKSYDPYGNEFSLKDMHLITCHANYRFNQTFSVYLNGAGQLNGKTERFWGYYHQNYYVLGGVNINF